MRVLHLLLLLFIAVPLVEIYLLLQVGGVIGAVPTIGLVVLTAAVGAVLVRAQGFSTIQEVRRSLDAGEVPAVAIVEGIWPGDSYGDPAGDGMGINQLVSADAVGPVGGVAFHDTAVWIKPTGREEAGAA